MKSITRFIRATAVLSVVMLSALACVSPVSNAPTATPQVITVVVEATQAPSPTASPTQPATATPSFTATPPPPTATTGPQCTVLQRLNFRSGPGTAFNPPLGVLDKDTVVAAQAFNPTGFPGGSWVQVVNPANNQVGWVSAGAQFVNCNFDLTSLPSVAVSPPPTPRPPSVSNSQPQGTFDGFDYELIFSTSSLLRIALRVEDLPGDADGDGVTQVKFIVQTQDGNPVYETTEGKAAFCIFGGDNPGCNPWPVTNYQLTWGAGGPALTDGTYKVRIEAEGVDSFGTTIYGNWRFDVTLDVP